MSRKLMITAFSVSCLAAGLFAAPACQDSNPAPAQQTEAIRAPGAPIPTLTAPRPSMRSPERRNLWSYPKAAGEALPYRPHAVVVRFRDELRGQISEALAGSLGLSIRRASPIGVHLMDLVTKETVEQAVERLNKDPRVRYAEPDYRIRFLNTPNDPRYPECWGLNNTGQTGGTADADIDAAEAWDISIGSWDVVVAVLDTGVDYTHPDLAPNMWTNQDEIPGNGIDDDNNGYIDDVIGWDFENQVNDPMDDYGHGTHCSGTIGAVGNDGQGVAGVNWRVTIMPLRIIGNQELDAYCIDAAEAIHYAVDKGADVMSCSWWTVEHYNQTLEEAVQYSEQMGVLLVAAAGNDSRDDDDPGYNHWPSEWPYDNIIAVAATNHDDGRAYFSNFGPTTVDVGAPGEDILSTIWPGHGYDTMSGTSMATPHTAGTVALMMSIRPDLTYSEIRQFLFQTVDPIPDLQGVTVTGGRINAYTALAAISGVPLPPVALAGGDQTVMTGATVTLDGSASFDPNQDPITYAWSFFPPAASSASLDDDSIATPQFVADTCGEYQADLTVTDDGGLVSTPDRARVHVMNWADQNPVVETPHPYTDNMDQTWTITIPGAVVMGVHFASFDTENGYDFVRILDSDDAEWAVYDGTLGAFNSLMVDGNTIRIRFTSDTSVTRDGFVVDGVWWCDAGNCPPGQGDCNDDPSDGCETDTTADLSNCGWCGHVCSFSNADATCNSGLCELVDCTAGFTDCDTDVANGCESDLQVDPNNCGACGTVCGPYPNATAGCSAGGCTIGACDSGWDDCNGVLDDGCEASVLADPDNCGGCGIQCTLDHAVQTYCEDAACHVGACTLYAENIETAHPYSNYQDLNWQIVHPGATEISVHFSLFSTERNYDYVQILDGSDNLIAQYWGDLEPFTADPVPGDTINIAFHSDVSVVYDGFIIDSSRACGGTGCEAGWSDCDGLGGNGCESDVSADPDNCGACNAACVFNHGSGACQNSACVISACDSGFDDCNSDGRDGCESELASDPDHCGACSTACLDVFPNAEVTCVAGNCQMGACLAGFDDCNGEFADGCEVDVHSDPAHCGACGQICNLDHATAGCTAGTCTIATCDMGWDNCDHAAANGCEQNVTDDEANCGGCGINCNVAHASAHCAGVVCVIDSCDDGYADCDANERNGCEAQLDSDVDHCGDCANACSFPGSVAICQNGVCALGDCAPDHFDCNADPSDGCEANVMSDVGNCGQCGHACSDNHADSRCINGACFMGDCQEGFADCNHKVVDGCEVDIGADAQNCGGCGSACALEHATAACSASECVVAACSQGWGDCDAEGFNGCEVDLDADPNHCGGCGQACDLANATSECQAGQCALDRCDNGFDDCNNDDADGCEVNKLTDTGHCGHCSVACPSGQTCEMGVCTCVDADGDGYEDLACGGDDCQDDDSLVNPAAAEECGDGLDNDCDGRTDENCDTEPPDDGGGCGCATSSRPAAGLLWLALIGLVVARRRRS